MSQVAGEAFRTVADLAPRGNYRGAVVGCGRMGSTIDDEHIGMAHYPWPWAHAPAIQEARGIELVAGADVSREALDDFRRRWGVEALYEDFREMVAQQQPELVAVTTRPAMRADVVIGLAEAGVKAIFATKPMCRTLLEADEMIDACRRHGTILAIACHLNWYSWYSQARKAIGDGEIGQLRSMVCHSPHSLSNLQSHTLALFRLFAGAPAQWVFGEMDNDEQAQGDEDLSGSGYIAYENGVRAFLNSRADRCGQAWTLEFIGEFGKIVTRNAHAQFELWSRHPETGEPVQRQFPNPWQPRSSMVDAIEGVCRSIEAGKETTCPGEFGREALEIVLALRESHRRGMVRVDLPLYDRSLCMGH
ncbi:MAG: Gfo/Idh/MocA family oxidoreductase [Candidatus Latescibacterota bacterium]|nr:Gfo/Idh/MocA family oxidoreductase [Candidatus Latescibacterota bacterium]